MFKQENDKQIVSMLGLKNTGKDYNAKPFIEAGFKKIAFADSLRSILWGILGYTPDGDNIPYNDFKKCEFKVKKSLFKTESITTVRKMLQNTGSVFKELFGQNYWTNKWVKDVLESDNNKIVVTDTRFDYEIKKIISLKKKGYKVNFIWCQYEGADYNKLLSDTHESEALAQFMYKNRDKYGLYDTCTINEINMLKILKDFNKHNKNLNK